MATMLRRILLPLLALAILGPLVLNLESSSQALAGWSVRFGFLVFQLALVGILVAILPPRWLAASMGSLVLPSLQEWVHLRWMGSYTSLGYWKSVFSTNPAEVRSLLAPVWPVVAGGVALTLASLFLVHRPPRLSRRHRIVLLTASIAPLAAIGARDLLVLHRIGFAGSSLVGNWQGLQLGHVRQSHPLGIPVRIFDAWSRIGDRRAQDLLVRKFRYGARRSSEPAPGVREVVVVVLGEASRAASWQLLGGDSGTTPRLSARTDLLAFRDVFSPANATHYSLPLLMTKVPLDNWREASKETGLLGVFKEAGFQTWWISNQPSGMESGPLAGTGLLADSSWNSSAGDAFQTSTDEVLLPQLRKALRSASPRVFVVLHMIGSHWRYSERYTTRDECFRPAYRGALYPSASDTHSLRNAYRNSIHLTDRVLDSAIGTIEGSGRIGILAYVSDHGENLMDDDRLAILHVRAEPTLEEAKVPLVFWASPGWVEADSVRWSLARKRTGLPVVARSLFASICQIARVDVPGLDTSRSLFSPTWSQEPRAMLNPAEEIVPESRLR